MTGRGIEKPTKGPKVTAAHIQVVLAALNGELDWVTAEELAKRTDLSDRVVRKVANVAAARIISYPGSPGYKLAENCAIEELVHAFNSFRSQGEDMIRRSHVIAAVIRRRAPLVPAAKEIPLPAAMPRQLELLPS